jgi:hypothetical protein
MVAGTGLGFVGGCDVPRVNVESPYGLWLVFIESRRGRKKEM